MHKRPPTMGSVHRLRDDFAYFRMTHEKFADMLGIDTDELVAYLEGRRMIPNPIFKCIHAVILGKLTPDELRQL